MLLAEALAERSDTQKRLEQVKMRLLSVARVQEGDVPDEDPQVLMAEAERLLDRLQVLVSRINATNARTLYDARLTVTDAIAARDLAARRAKLYADVANAAADRADRYTRNEIRYVAALSVADARNRANAAAKQFRELDTRLQQLNWSTELL